MASESANKGGPPCRRSDRRLRVLELGAGNSGGSARGPAYVCVCVCIRVCARAQPRGADRLRTFSPPPRAVYAAAERSLRWEPRCRQQLRHLQDGARIAARLPPRLEGQWVSTG